jgi:AmmeMemoRadiSam system protein A
MRGIGSIPEKRAYRTPLGDVPLDPVCAKLRERAACFKTVEAAHFWESAIEVQLPFLQRRLTTFTLVPALLDDRADADAIAESLEDLLLDPATVLVATAGAAHTRETGGGAVDAAWIDHVMARDSSALVSDRFCGQVPVRVLLALAARLGWTAEIVPRDGNTPVGDACILFRQAGGTAVLLRASAEAEWKDPETREAFRGAVRASSRKNFQGDFLSSGEEVLLLDLARRSIVNTLTKKDLPAAPLYSSTLARKLGCFVTLEKNGRLRGCIGNLNPDEPLASAVQKNALRAAFKDSRFKPVTLAEMSEIALEVSVLTEPEEITFRDAADLLSQLEKGRHGVVITSGDHRATYLPQVWSQIPDKEAFLSNLCRKGGMSADAWRDPENVTVQFYEVFAFGETEAE